MRVRPICWDMQYIRNSYGINKEQRRLGFHTGNSNTWWCGGTLCNDVTANQHLHGRNDVGYHEYIARWVWNFQWLFQLPQYLHTLEFGITIANSNARQQFFFIIAVAHVMWKVILPVWPNYSIMIQVKTYIYITIQFQRRPRLNRWMVWLWSDLWLSKAEAILLTIVGTFPC